jgi:hypothetical protein
MFSKFVFHFCRLQSNCCVEQAPYDKCRAVHNVINNLAVPTYVSKLGIGTRGGLSTCLYGFIFWILDCRVLGSGSGDGAFQFENICGNGQGANNNCTIVVCVRTTQEESVCILG